MSPSSDRNAEKRVYLFHEGNATMRDLLGGKGANLAEMTNLEIPVPPGFTITTTTCNAYVNNGYKFPEGLMDEVMTALHAVEKELSKTFGDKKNPLLLSVRSGAKFSMPGMMETILNLGLNDESLEGLKASSQNERFAWDSYRRFISMFGSVVLGIHKDEFEHLLEEKKHSLKVKQDVDLDARALQEVVDSYKALIKRKLGKPFPQDPVEQLKMAIEAVFKSWNTPRAFAYRNYHRIDHTLGTAVNVQSMVFGNLGNDSATGVAFSRNPSNGENALYGEYLVNAQGEDVVAGIRTPRKIAELSQEMPELYNQFHAISQRLEKHYRDIQDVEFTIERGRLFILQTRNGKRTIQAAVSIALDMVKEGLISKEEALLRVEADQLPQLLLPHFDPASVKKAKTDNRLLARGINASPGTATGVITFDPDEAVNLAQKGKDVILVRIETSPDDVHGMIVAKGVLTSRGGNTSHAAVVARGMGKPCVVGCEDLSIDMIDSVLTVHGQSFKKGDTISIDGTTGDVYAGYIETIDPELNEDLKTLLNWADEVRTMEVRANADTPEDAHKAVELGAQGVGLCRTEHMFMATERLPVVQEMILSDTLEARQKALAKLLPMQREDFKAIFKILAGHPVTIRLLDPPLHEFLPNHDKLLEEVVRLWTQSKGAGKDSVLVAKEKLLAKVNELRESNPMLGFRGCRLGVIYPEIYEMQVRAIFEAATDLAKDHTSVIPEVMIPLVSDIHELTNCKEHLEAVANQVMEAKGITLQYKFGTMIEVPRAALTADEIAQQAEFFSFGTNDLTQMTYGFSRDDAEEKFLNKYVETGIFKYNPFCTLDEAGVGQLIEMAKTKGRATRPNLKVGICGEHGGDATSVQFCHKVGLDYVSCSPFRVPVARLASAQAVVQAKTANYSNA